MINSQDFKNYLDELFPDARCELNYNDAFTLLLAVMLSAQTTDKAVNNVTPELFSKYPTCYDLARASIDDIEKIIKPLGLYKNKAKNLIAASQCLIEKFNGKIPSTIDELTMLPGVGRKTASVVMIEYFHKPAFPVDTHIERVCKRLKFVSEKSSVFDVEAKIRKIYDSSLWGKLHHQIIFFGRYFCTAKNPHCEECKLSKECKYFKNK